MIRIPFTIKNKVIYLTSDDSSYSLSIEREVTRKGVTTTDLEPFKWYVNLESALDKLLNMKVQSSDATTPLELRKVMEQAREEVTRVWKTSE